jgi:hypothetical protein
VIYGIHADDFTLVVAMTAIEIRVNGKLIATCGAEDMRAVAAMVTAGKPRDGDSPFAYFVECHGVRPKSAQTDEVLKWVKTAIELGDEVSLKIVHTAEVDRPIDRQEISANAPDDK